MNDSLKSRSVNERTKAIGWLAQHPREVSTASLLRALQNERVPQLRAQLNRVLQTRQMASIPEHSRSTEHSVFDEVVTSLWEADIGGLVRHELSPAVGWIRLAADTELDDFAKSATNASVRKLQRRIDGLVALIKQGEELNLRQLDLAQLLRESWPDPLGAPVFDPPVELGMQTMEIVTDESLFCTLMSNVYQNAFDASLEASGEPQVSTSWGSTGDRFWLRVTNPFSGSQLKLADVLSSGMTSKSGHQGQGLGVITSISTLLNLVFTLEGKSGLAVFSLAGARAHD